MKRIFSKDLEPKLLSVLREGYSLQDFWRDALAGMVVGVVALPLAIAFAIASGLRPEQGLYTAIVGGFAISFFGGSRVQIGGPTAAFVVLVASVVAEFGYGGLAVATFMAGCFLVIMAFARLGDVIRFIPYPVTVGFTTGIALTIAMSQVGEALGLQIESLPTDFVGRSLVYAENFSATNLTAAFIFLLTVAIIQIWPRVPSRIPGPLVALVVTTAIVQLAGLDIATIHSRFGDVPQSLPTLQLSRFDWKLLPELVSPALTIALLAAIESLLSAVVADGLIGGRHRSNAELFGQGLANILSPLFGGMPATGAIARTATNVRNGGRTPIAGIVHAATLLLIVLVAGSWASLIPMAALAGILIVVAYNMSEWHVFQRLLRGPASDALVLVTTFLLTIIFDLSVAIQVGVVLAALLFMRRMAEVTQVKALRDITDYEDSELRDAYPTPVPAGVGVFQINGSFCFGAATKFTETLLTTQSSPPVVILRMRHVLAIDATGLHALEEVAARFQGRGTVLLLSGVSTHVQDAMDKNGALKLVGKEHIFANFPLAVEHAQLLLAAKTQPD